MEYKRFYHWVILWLISMLLSSCQYYGTPAVGSYPPNLPPGTVQANIGGDGAISPLLSGEQIPPNGTRGWCGCRCVRHTIKKF